MTQLNDEDYFPPVPDIENDEYKEDPGDDDPDEYLSNDKDVSYTKDGIPSQDNNRLGGKILSVWERYNTLLKNDYSRTGYMLFVDDKKYAHVNVSVFYIYVNNHVIFLQFIILKRI